MIDDEKEAGLKQPEVWWQEALKLFAGFGGLAVLIVSASHACAVVEGSRSEQWQRREQTARVFATSCMRDAGRGRFDCIEACRTSPDQQTCIEEVNTLAPQWQPNPNRRFDQ